MPKSIAEQIEYIENLKLKAPFIEPMALANAMLELLEYLKAKEKAERS